MNHSFRARERPPPWRLAPADAGEVLVAESAQASFGELLSRHRRAANLTREDLAEKARIHSRTIAGLELRKTHKPHRDTVRLLADALELTGTAREEFEAAARGSA